MRYPIGFMKCNNTAGLYQIGHFGHNLLRLWNIHQNKTGCGKVERLSFKTASAAVSLLNLDVGYPAVCEETACELHSVFVHLYADYVPLRANAIGKEFKAPLRTTTDFDHSGSRPNSHLIEEPVRFGRAFQALLLQPALLGHAVT